MTTHTAIAATALGQFDAIQVLTEKPGLGDVLIKVDFASMIAFDTYVTDKAFYVDKYPKILGFNVAGSIVEPGEGVSSLAVGDRVGFNFFYSIYFSLNYSFLQVVGFSVYGTALQGTMQQFISLPAHLCAKVRTLLQVN
jgi:NADPH:quinone reductase-like Zn-dependent oxidoreductase